MKSYDEHSGLSSNLTMLTDFYEITMTNGYFSNGFQDQIACNFEMLSSAKYQMMAASPLWRGLSNWWNIWKVCRFSPEDIAFLRSTRLFREEFLDYLSHFAFSCDVWAVPEGTPIFPMEPIVTVRGPAVQAQFIETMMLLSINHQSLIATKANRICRAAQGRPVMEFGSRRAQGFDGAIYGARAAFIGGCCGTACTLGAKKFNIPAIGTMAHSWIQLFDNELDAFRAYAREYPENCILLVDTYNVLKSGIPNAIQIFQEELTPRGIRRQVFESTAVISPTFPGKPAKCWTMLDFQIVPSAPPALWMNISFKICSFKALR